MYRLALLALLVPIPALAQDRENKVWVDSYTRTDGTHVRGHWRSRPGHTQPAVANKVRESPTDEADRLAPQTPTSKAADVPANPAPSGGGRDPGVAAALGGMLAIVCGIWIVRKAVGRFSRRQYQRPRRPRRETDPDNPFAF